MKSPAPVSGEGSPRGEDTSAGRSPADDAPDGAALLAAAGQPMPFGRFAGTPLIDLPEPYLVWFSQRGFPGGRLGERMALMLEIKTNGLEKLVRPLLARHLDPRIPQD